MKLWGGRFGKATDGLVDDFHSSISFDQRLFEQDITGSVAHATMLGEVQASIWDETTHALCRENGVELL